MGISKANKASVFWKNMDKCQREVESWPEWKKVSITKYGGNISSLTQVISSTAQREISEEKEEFVKNLFKRKLKDIEGQERAVNNEKEKLNNLRDEYADMGRKSVDELYKEYNVSGGVVISLDNLYFSAGYFSVK